MSPMQKFNLSIEPGMLAALKAIEDRTGAPVSEQIRRAVAAYLQSQKVLSQTELKRLLASD